MDLVQELANLKTLLRIPIDSIEDLGIKVHLLLGGTKIGFVPYFKVNDIIHFETGDDVLNKINWNHIFNENRTEIIVKIKEQLEFEEEDEIRLHLVLALHIEFYLLPFFTYLKLSVILVLSSFSLSFL
jgi:hypothetical protein